MKILAVDQSFTCTGIVVMNDRQSVDHIPEMVHCEIFKTEKGKDIYLRSWEVVQKLCQMYSDHEPDVVALESLSFSSFGNATRDLAGLQFSIVTYLRYVHEYDVRIVPIGTIKKLATGRGNAKKMELLECLPKDVRKTFDDIGVKKTTGLLDLTDAYWLGRTAITLNDIKEMENK